MFGRRSDATRVADLDPMRAFMPFVSPRRNESLVYFDSEIEVDAALEFLDRHNSQPSIAQRATLFHLYLRALAMHLELRPRVNRFTKGGRLWQRRGVWLTFSALQEIADGAVLLTVKREFPADESLDEMVGAVLQRLTRRRGGERTSSDREMGLALRLLPPALIHLVMRGLRLADHFGCLPRSMIEADPMFASAFVANLGSLDMDAGYHHLWEYGTCPLFCMLGRVKDRGDAVRVLPVRYTYDERIEDGLYAGITLKGIKETLEHPEKLL